LSRAWAVLHNGAQHFGIKAMEPHIVGAIDGHHLGEKPNGKADRGHRSISANKSKLI
jgi:hypothetical protein